MWGTADTVSFLVWTLPLGSGIAICDVASAYRNVPLDPLQWPAAVIRIGKDTFAADTCGAFRAKSIGEVWGSAADTAADIMRARGHGPLTRWVDDFIFLCIHREHAPEYNRRQARACKSIIAQSGGELQQKCGHIWWGGVDFTEAGVERHAEDLRFPILELANGAPPNAPFTYGMVDIDTISAQLGLPWGPGKTRKFVRANSYVGFVWDVQSKAVSITEEKHRRYLASIK
jgi:hypothetical protein